jgi:hypothetical protein
MKAKIFVVYCVKGLEPAQIYKKLAYAFKKIDKNPSYTIKAFADED